ncbi:DnaJ domain-containing protein [Fluviicola sp.]|uniref:DnaJ domain-containing protein n=1 Tax=Fluviicola sp. TaxID=1917219 RepID=UPI0031E1004D
MIEIGLLLVSYGVPEKVDPVENAILVTCIIGPFVLALLYFLYLRSKGKHKITFWLGKRMPAAYSDLVFREIQIVLAVAMIKRDRYCFMVKRNRIHQFVQRVYDKKLDADEIIDMFLDDKIPLADLIEWCNKFISYERKLETFLFLIDIAFIDHELVDTEKEYLLFIIQKFAIRNQDISQDVQEKLFENHGKVSARNSVSGFESYYEVLEIASDATDKEVKESYRRLVKQFHPDSHPHLTVEEKKALSDKFQRVQEAYDHLMSN